MRPMAGERKVSIGAIVLGYFTFAGTGVLLNVVAGPAIGSLDPKNTRGLSSLPVSVFFGAIAAVLGGYVAGISARRNETRHGVILGAILALTASAPPSLDAPCSKGWPIGVGLIVVSLSAGLGGFLRGRQQSRRA